MEKFQSELYASTPNRPNLPNFLDEANIAPSDIGSPPSDIKEKKVTVLDMVIEAINAVGVPRKGASYQAIKKWIIANKETDPQRLKSSLKVAVIKGINKGILQRPKNSESAVGATGFFKLAVTGVLKSSKKTVNKPVAPSDQTVVLNSKANKKAPPTKASGITSKKVKPPSPSKYTVAKNSKKSSKQAEPEKRAASKASSKAKAEPEKRTASKASSKAEPEKKPVAKAPSKAKSVVPASKVKAKMPVAKEKVEKKPNAKAPSKANAPKSPQENSPKSLKDNFLFSDSQSDEDPEEISETPTARKVFSDSQSDEDPTNVETISEAPKRGKVNVKAQGKNKAMKNDAVSTNPVEVENTNVIKDKKGKVVKETKRLPKPDGTSNDKPNARQKIAKTVNNKKLYTSENDFERLDLSDTEIAIKKKHMKVLKSFSSDTELEVSKREEKKPKRGLRGKKVESKA